MKYKTKNKLNEAMKLLNEVIAEIERQEIDDYQPGG